MRRQRNTKRTKRPSSHETLEWLGVALIISAYGLLSFGIIDQGFAFQTPTLVGSLIVAIESWIKRDRQPAILNFIFAAIALLAIIRLFVLH